jgi:hypothetical protein
LHFSKNNDLVLNVFSRLKNAFAFKSKANLYIKNHLRGLWWQFFGFTLWGVIIANGLYILQPHGLHDGSK